MAGTSKGGRKFADRKRQEDPDYYSNLSKKAKKPRGGKSTPGSFKKGNQFGKLSKPGKRTPGKSSVVKAKSLSEYPLEYEELQ